MRSLVYLPLLFASVPVYAQDAEPEPQDEAAPADPSEGNEIVVTASRLPGQVVTSQPPIATLDEADVASYGASTIGELLEALAPETGSGRGRGEGRPVILLNGQRISSFRQLRDLPPEAIRQMEVLPEEVALQFGYPPNQRVVNIILKDAYGSVQMAGEFNIPTRGGFAESELEAGLLRISGPRRLSLNYKLEDTSLLTEAERDVIQADGSQADVPGDPNPAAFRSLVSDSVTHTLNGSWSTGLGDEGRGGTLTVDGSVSRADSRSLSGLDSVLLIDPAGSSALRTLGDPLTRDARTDTIEGGVTFNKPLGAWQLTATADATYAEARTRIDRRRNLDPLAEAALAGTLALDGTLSPVATGGFDRATGKDFSLDSVATVSGRPFTMPAGDASLTVDAGYTHLSSRNEDTRNSGIAANLNRDVFKGGANLSVPIASRRNDALAAIGDLTVSFGGGVDHLSDFGTLTDWNAGLTWSPVEKLSLQASYIVNEAAPSLSQLGQPEVRSFNVPVYDFATGQPALVTVVSGGNPGLLAETQRDIKLSASYDLDLFRRSNIRVEYFRNRSSDVTSGFPLLTPAVEAAFPDRVVRDGNGALLSIDRRPVTFDRVASESLRWGLNFSGAVGKEPERGARGEGARGEGRGGGGMPRFGRGRDNGQGRWNVSINHTWKLADTITIAPGVPTFDQLSGDALVAGGVPRHAIEAEGGVFYKGFGIRLNADWSAPATVRSRGNPGSSDLRFGSVLDIGARLFVNLDQQESLIARMPFLKGTRVALDFDNLLDSRQRVTDGNGVVPLAYQADYRDPRGRFIGIDIRKRF